MSNFATVKETKELRLDQLEIGKSQARVRGVDKGIDNLAASINKLGLLEPIVVAPLGDDKYEIITGQRRFLAHLKLERKTILAQILDRRLEAHIAKAFSLTENMLREDMSTRDYIDACTELFRRYGSIKAVSEELGLPYNDVSQYVKFDQLIPVVKEMVEKGEVNLTTALRAQKAATGADGTVDTERARLLVAEMRGMAGVQQRVLERLATSNQDLKPDELVELGRRQPKVKQIVVTLSEGTDQALNKFAVDEGSNKDEAAASLLEQGLTSKGYI